MLASYFRRGIFYTVMGLRLVFFLWLCAASVVITTACDQRCNETTTDLKCCVSPDGRCFDNLDRCWKDTWCCEDHVGVRFEGSARKCCSYRQSRFLDMWTKPATGPRRLVRSIFINVTEPTAQPRTRASTKTKRCTSVGGVCYSDDNCCWNPCSPTSCMRCPSCDTGICIGSYCLSRGTVCTIDCQCCSNDCMINEFSPGFCN